jgi:hypothetical protein
LVGNIIHYEKIWLISHVLWIVSSFKISKFVVVFWAKGLTNI